MPPAQAPSSSTQLVVHPSAPCPWGDADLSWTGASDDQRYTCTHSGIELEVGQSSGVEAAKEEDGKSLHDDVRLGNTGLVVWYSAPMLCVSLLCLPLPAVRLLRRCQLPAARYLTLALSCVAGAGISSTSTAVGGWICGGHPC